MLAEDNGPGQEVPPKPASSSWSQVEESLKIHELPPAKRLEAFDEWRTETGNKLLAEGALDKPEAVLKWKENVLRQKRRLSDDFMMDPDPQIVQRDMELWKTAANDPARQVKVPVRLIRNPELYRKAVLESDASFDAKAVALSNRGSREQEHARDRRNEVTETLRPRAKDIANALQEGQEILGLDVANVSDDLKLQKDSDGNWTIPTNDFWQTGMLAGGAVAREKMDELKAYQDKWNLTDQEVQDDYLSAITRTAPGSIDRGLLPDKTDMGEIDSRLKGEARVFNQDIGAPEIHLTNQDLFFDKDAYDKAVDTAEAPDEVKEQAKALRERNAQIIAPQLFNGLLQHRGDFKDYAEEAGKVKGTEAPAAMVKAVEKYYADKKDQSWYSDLGEMAGQMGSGGQEGLYRMAALPSGVLGLLGSKEEMDKAALADSYIKGQSQADASVAGQLSMPGTVQFGRDFAGVVPDLVLQVGMAMGTGGAANIAAASRVAAAAGVESTVARQAIQIAARAGGKLAATEEALTLAGLSTKLAKPATEALTELTSKNLLTGAAGRQTLYQSGYAGVTQAASTSADLYNRLKESGMDENEAFQKSRVGGAVAGAITALVTGTFTAMGHGGVEKPMDPSKYTVKDLVKTGLWKDPAARSLVKQTAKGFVKDVSDEALEEGVDQYLQGVASFATDPTAKDKTLSEVFSESAYAAALGGAGGGAANVVRNAQWTTKLTGKQIKDSEALKDVIRKMASGELTTEQGLAAIADEKVDAGDLASSLEEMSTTAGAIKDVAPATAAVLEQLSGTEPEAEISPGEDATLSTSLTPAVEEASGVPPGEPVVSEQPAAPYIPNTGDPSLDKDVNRVLEIAQVEGWTDPGQVMKRLKVPSDRAYQIIDVIEKAGLIDLHGKYVAPVAPLVSEPPTLTNEEIINEPQQTPGLETTPGETGSPPVVVDDATGNEGSGSAAIPEAGDPFAEPGSDLPPEQEGSGQVSESVAAPVSGTEAAVEPIPATENQSPGSEPLLTAGDSSRSDGDLYAEQPGLQTPDTDVGQVDTVSEPPTTPEVKPETPAEKPATPPAKKAKSALGPVPKEATAKQAEAHAKLEELIGRALPDFSRIFKGVEVVADAKGVYNRSTGGFYFNPNNGKLGISLEDAARELGRSKNPQKWAAAGLMEEALHSVIRKLAREGKIALRPLWEWIKKEAPKVAKAAKAAYPTAANELETMDEFLRMLGQGRIVFSLNGVTIDGEFTEMQIQPGFIAAIKRALEQMLAVVKDLKRAFKKSPELAAELQKTQDLLESALKELVMKAREAVKEDEDFVWNAEDDISGTQPSGVDISQVSYSPEFVEQNYGDAKFEQHELIYPPNERANGTTFLVEAGSTPEQIQAAAIAKAEQFERQKGGDGGGEFKPKRNKDGTIRFSQPSVSPEEEIRASGSEFLNHLLDPEMARTTKGIYNRLLKEQGNDTRSDKIAQKLEKLVKSKLGMDLNLKDRPVPDWGFTTRNKRQKEYIPEIADWIELGRIENDLQRENNIIPVDATDVLGTDYEDSFLDLDAGARNKLRSDLQKRLELIGKLKDSVKGLYTDSEIASLAGEIKTLVNDFSFADESDTSKQKLESDFIRLYEALNKSSGISGTQPSQSTVTPEMDAAYMKAVESGDMEMAQRMVDDAAKGAGYTIGPVYHGTQSQKKFTKFEGMWNYRFPAEKGTSYFTNDQDIASGYGVRVLSAYLKLDNPLTKDAKGQHWTIVSPSAIVAARKEGNDGVIIKNVLDTPAGKTERPVDVYVSFIKENPGQIKLAEPVIYDDRGNVIPLSQRFNPQSSDIRFSQPSEDPRAQVMGVPNLGNERPAEPRTVVREAVRNHIFNADEMTVDSWEDYQTAHDLVRTLTSGDSKELEKLYAKIKDDPVLAELEAGIPTSLPAVILGEVSRYAIRQATEGGDGRTADFSLLKTILDNYGNLPMATLKMMAGQEDDKAASAVTQVARILSSLQEISEPFGAFLKHHAEVVLAGKEALLAKGFTEKEIQALNDFITRPEKTEEYTQAVDTAADDLIAKQGAELERLRAAIERLTKLAPETGSITEDQLSQWPKDLQEAYKAMLRGRLHGATLSPTQLASVEEGLFNARDQMEESGIKALGDAFFVGGKKRKDQTMLGEKVSLVNSQMGSLIRETLKQMGIVPEKDAGDPDKVYADIAKALGSDELRLKKVPLIEAAIQKRIAEESEAKTFEGAMQTEWGREMWAQWQTVADTLNATTKVSGGILTRAIRQAIKAGKMKLGDIATKPEELSKVVDSVMEKVQEVSGRAASNIQPEMWPKVREEVAARLNQMAAQSLESKAKKAKAELPFDVDAMLEAEARKISGKHATPDTPDSKAKEADVNLSLRKLARLHLQEAQPDFMEIATNMGLSEDAAATLEKSITSAREARETVQAYRDEQAKAKEVEESVEAKLQSEIRRIMGKYRTPDTWLPDKVTKEKGELQLLAEEHLKSPVVNFVERATAMGLTEDQAAQLEKDVSATRDAKEMIREERKNNPSQKRMDEVVNRLLAKTAPGKKVASIKEIVQALAEEPQEAENPAFRKEVVRRWLSRLGVDIGKVRADKLDALIATVFADAKAKLLRDFMPKASKKGKVQPSEVERMVKAMQVGILNGSPVEWQAALAKKHGIRPLTTEEMRDVLYYSQIEGNKSGQFNMQDQTIARGKLFNILRRAGGDPKFMEIVAASFTTSALTGISTQTLQFTAAGSNFVARIYEDILSGLVTGKGIAPVMNSIQTAFDSYVRSFGAAFINDHFRTQQLDEIQKLSVLKTHLENKIKQFKEAGNLKRIALLPSLMVGFQDFFRRTMSSADDAGVTGLKSYISTVEGQKLLRAAGVTQTEINKMFDVAKEHMVSLSDNEEWLKRRPNYTKSDYKAWVMDESAKVLRASMEEALALKMIAQGKTKEEARQAFQDLDTFAGREAQADIGVGELRDIGSRGDPLQLAGEWIVKGVEKALRLNPKDTDENAPLKYLGARMLFGFVRTPWNSLSRAVYRGPFGLYRLAVTGALFKHSERAAKLYQRTMGTAQQQSQRRREGLVWSLSMAGLYLLAKGLSGDKDDPEDDVVVVNGRGPEDEQARDAWRAAGHQPNSLEVNIGGTKLSVPFGRSGMEILKPGLMILGTMDDMRQNGMSKQTPETLWQWTKTYAGNTIYSASMFGFRNIASWRQDYGSGENKALKTLLYSLSPLIPFSGTQKSIGKLISPEKADDRTLKGAVAASTPLWWIGEKSYNVFGQPTYGSPNSTVGTVSQRLLWGIGLPWSVDIGTDPKTLEAYKFLLKTGRGPSAPSREDIDRRMKKADPKHEPLTDAEWVNYSKAAGASRLESMKAFAPRGINLPDNLIDRNMTIINNRADQAGKRAVKGN